MAHVTEIEPRAKPGTVAYWLTSVHGHGRETWDLNIRLMSMERRLTERGPIEMALALHEPLDNLSDEMRDLTLEMWQNLCPPPVD